MPPIAFFESARDHNIRPSADVLETLAAGSSLYAHYDMDELQKTANRGNPARYAAQSPASLGMWRYKDVLPSGTPDHPVVPVTLGEGWTPLVRSKRNPGLLIKEEGHNPTGSWNARGLGMAVTMATYYGLKQLAIASAGDAAGALAAYSAAANVQAHLYMPHDVPRSSYLEAIAYGADVHITTGSLSDCSRVLSQRIKAQRAANVSTQEVWFDISTSLEPFRVEGSKTMGYELVEQLGWQYPKAVLYPIGGAGAVGMWKAFDEIEQLGWLEPGSLRPRIYVQSSGCAPVAGATLAKADQPSSSFLQAETLAGGLLTAESHVDDLTLDIVRRSGGKCLSVDDDTVLSSLFEYAKNEGLLLSPEGAAASAMYDLLLEAGELTPQDTVVLINAVSGLKRADIIAAAMQLRTPGRREWGSLVPKLPTSLPVGGIITPV